MARPPRRPAPRKPAARPRRPRPATPEPTLSEVADEALRHALCAAGRRLFERDLIGAGEGNLSARRADGSLLVTPAGVGKGHLAPGDLLVVEADGTVVSGHGRPSSELAMHLAAYRARPELAAAVHAHPLTAVALTVAGLPWPGDLVPEAAVTLGEVAVAPFAVPGTAAVAAALAPYLPDHEVILLARHGALCLGGTVSEAVDRMETLERVARIALLARALGGCTPLAPAQVEAVLRAAGRPPRGPA